MWLVYAISAAALWGLDYTVGERVLKSKISPVTLLAVELTCGALVFLGIGFCQTLKTDIQTIIANPQILKITLCAIVTFNLANLLVFFAIGAKNATSAGLIELCYPLFTLFFAYVLFHENQASIPLLIGGLFIIVGVSIIGYAG